MEGKKHIIYYDSPLGKLQIIGDDEAVYSLLFDKEYVPASDGTLPTALAACCTQLDEFFEGTRKDFELPLQPAGTFFQQSVWSELRYIPYGKTISYLELAKKLGDENSVRAVGSANGKNPIAIIIPCHRVIGMNHKLVGYGGGLWRKQWLLEHEEKYTKGVLRLF